MGAELPVVPFPSLPPSFVAHADCGSVVARCLDAPRVVLVHEGRLFAYTGGVLKDGRAEVRELV